MFTMKIQLLKRTVKLRIDHHIITIPREKTTCTTTPTGFQRAFRLKHFASFLRKYEIRLKKQNKCKL